MYEVAKVANVVRVSHVNFHCNRLTTVQDIQDYVSLLLGGGTRCMVIAVDRRSVCTRIKLDS